MTWGNPTKKRSMAGIKAMVLAAGKGTRLAPLTEEVPKPMAPVAGRPVIGHIFGLLQAVGVEEVHVNVCHLADAVLDHFGWGAWLDGMTVDFTREEELSGTAGGVRRLASAAGSFDGTFVVIMGDALTDVDLPEVVAFHKEKGALATLALMRVTDTTQYGVVALDPDDNILAFQEKPEPGLAISTLANTGIYVLEPEALEYIPEDTFYDFANDVFPRLLEAGEKIVGYEGDFYWSDIGNLEAYRAAQGDALAGKVQVSVPGERWGEGLWVDRSARLHPTTTLAGRAVIGAYANIGSAVTLAGDVTVGDDCRVESGAVVEGSILLPGSRVGAGAHLKDCIVGPGYEVRPGECLRGEVLFRRTREDAPASAPRRSVATNV